MAEIGYAVLGAGNHKRHPDYLLAVGSDRAAIEAWAKDFAAERIYAGLPNGHLTVARMHELPPGTPEPAPEPARVSSIDSHFRSARRERTFEPLRSGDLYDWAEMADPNPGAPPLRS